MKIKLLLFIIIISFHPVHSQKKKKYYLDENSKQITKREFNSFDNNHLKYLKIFYENDTAKVSKIEKREHTGRLDNEKYQTIFKFLAKKDSKVIDSTKTIIINYYPGSDNCNSTVDNDYVIEIYRDYLADIKLIKNVNQYFIYKSKSGLESFKGYFDWLKDDENIFEKSFFPLHYPCNSYLIIYPNKDYFVYKGEYYILDVLKKI